MLLPDTDQRGAYVVAERLRAEIAHRFASEPRLTISFGVACFPDHARSAQELLRVADRALYAAKRLGRDRSVIFSDQLGEVLGSPGPLESEARAAQLTTLVSLAEALDLRDTGTSDHSETVARLSAMTAQELGLPPSQVERVGIAGRLHDIGKVAVPDSILCKAGPLEEHEWDGDAPPPGDRRADPGQPGVRRPAVVGPRPSRAPGRDAATRSAWRATRSRWRPASSRSPTPTRP